MKRNERSVYVVTKRTSPKAYFLLLYVTAVGTRSPNEVLNTSDLRILTCSSRDYGTVRGKKEKKEKVEIEEQTSKSTLHAKLERICSIFYCQQHVLTLRTYNILLLSNFLEILFM